MDSVLWYLEVRRYDSIFQSDALIYVKV